MSTHVRIQFSRDIDQSTLKGHVKASYLQSQTAERGEPDTPAAEFTTQYSAASRVLELRFTKPLERFRTIKIELSDEILGTDKQPLKAWTLSFDAGGAQYEPSDLTARLETRPSSAFRRRKSPQHNRLAPAEPGAARPSPSALRRRPFASRRQPEPQAAFPFDRAVARR